MYAYAGGGDEELPFEENDILEIVDQSDDNWWKTEKAGVIFLVPAAYLEILGKFLNLGRQGVYRLPAAG